MKMPGSKVEVYKLFISISLVVNIALGYLLSKYHDSEYCIYFKFFLAIWLFIFLRGIIYNVDIQIVPKEKKEKKDLANPGSFRNTSTAPSEEGKNKKGE